MALLILRGYVGVHVWYCGNKKIVGQGGITAEHRAQPKRTTQKRGEDAWSCANSKLSFLVLFPLPFPLPPGQSAGLPRGWACTFAQGGGGMGGGILFGLEFAQDHGSFSLFCGVFLGCTWCSAVMPPLAYDFLIATIPNMDAHISPQYQKCHP